MIGISISPLRPKVMGDSDVAAFISAAGITDATQKAAINTLVAGLKSNSLWTKMYAIYPIIGGTATTHKFNLKNPADSDAAYRLSFAGGWTHSSNGALPNGTTGYANTFLNPNTLSMQNSIHMSFYSRTNTVAGSMADMGCHNGSVYTIQNIAIVGIHYVGLNSTTFPSVAVADARKFWIDTRTASNVIKGYRDGSEIATGTNASSTPPNFPIFIGARSSSGTAELFSNKQCAFASIGTGLTPTDVTNFNTLVVNYNTTLGRNV